MFREALQGRGCEFLARVRGALLYRHAQGAASRDSNIAAPAGLGRAVGRKPSLARGHEACGTPAGRASSSPGGSPR